MKTIYKISLLLILYLFSSNISAQDQIDDLFFYINDRYGEGYVVVMGQTVTKANLTIPEEVVIGGKKYKVSHIGEGGFHCNRKIKSVVLPKSLLNISEKAFEQCENLTKIVFNENLKSIERDAFYRCTGLTQITLPSSIKYISYDAFYGCDNIKTIRINVKEPFETFDQMFTREVLKNARLIVPAGTKELYSKTKGWDLFQHIEEETTGIDAVTSNESKKDTYNLAGQKVSEGYKGIVIVNGKKVVVK